MTGTARTLIVAIVLGALGTSQALAWGSNGHRIIGVLGVHSLPPELPHFLRTFANAVRIGELAREPDRWRKSGEPHDAERDPAHFIKIADDLTVGGIPLASLPATRAEYDTALRAAGSSQYVAGYLPYAIIDGWQQIVTDFAYWRVDVAGEKFAGTAAGRTWFAADRRLREMLIVRDIGVWAHYVGDASQPMHASAHYDAWGTGPDPNGFVAIRGLHWRFEGIFTGTHVTQADVAPRVAPYRDCTCAVQNRTAAYLKAAQADVIPLYRLDLAGAFEAATPEARTFAAARLAAAAGELRDLIVDAWRASADAKVGFTQVSVKAAEAGDAKALAAIRND